MDKYLLNQKIINKINEVNELKILVDKKEKIIKESEEKYNILYESINLDKIKQFNTTLNINSDDALNLSIQLSELKGILEGKEKNFNKYKEEKETLFNKLKFDLETLKNENENLKEINIKYDNLQERFNKKLIEDSNKNNLKEKLLIYEKKIVDLEDQNKTLKNFDVETVKVVRKIDEISLLLTKEKNENLNLKKELEQYRNIIANSKDNLNELNQNLFTFGDEMQMKQKIIELETKNKIYLEDNFNLLKDKKELEDLVDKLNDDINNTVKEVEKLTKKEEKYMKLKKEYKNNIINITQLKENNHKVSKS